MTRPIQKVNFFFLLSLLLACVALQSVAQILPQAPKAEEKLPEAPLPLEDIEADRAWVERRLELATAGLTETQAAVARAGDVRDGDEIDGLNSIAMLQNFRVLALRQHLELLSEVELTRQELEQQRLEAAWPSSVEPPSDVPAGMAEALERWQALNQFHEEDEAERIRAEMYVKGRQQSMTLLKTAGQEYRRALETLESARTDDSRRLAREAVALGRVTEEFAQERLAYFAARERAQKERAELLLLRGRVLEDALARVLRGLKLSEADLNARRDATEKELAEAQTMLARLADEETALDARIREAQVAALSSGTTGEAPPHDGSLSRMLNHADVLHATADDISTLYLVWLNLELTWWQRRFQLESYPDRDELHDLPDSIDETLTTAAQALRLIVLTRSEVAGARADLERASQSNSPDTAEFRAALERRIDLLDRAEKATARTAAFLTLWQSELADATRGGSLVREGGEWIAAAGDTANRLWNYELFAVEDRITVDGDVVVEKRPVTFGKGVLALAVLSVGLVVASWVGRISGVLLTPVYRHRWGNRLVLEKLIRAVTISLAIIIALVTVKIPLAVFAFLGGALAIGVGFGAQNLINNFISGFILLAERPIRPGDIIETEGVRCRVETIGERCTRVRRFDGVEILIPNSQLLEQSVTNMTHSDQRMRASIKVGVAYGSSTRDVQEVLTQIAIEHPLVLKDPKPMVIFESLGESALNFVLYFWVDLPAQPDWRMVASDLLHRVCERMAEENIAIPFPQRGVHLDVTHPLPVEVIGPNTTTQNETGPAR